MKKIGIIGGVTWVSTTEYYRSINQKVNQQLGGQHSAKMMINSVDFAEVLDMLNVGDWDKIESLMLEKALELKAGGADLLAIGSNTIAKVGKSVSQKAGLELIDLFEATSIEIKKLGLKKVALLGTAFTMTDPFYVGDFARNGVNAIVPNPDEIELVHNIIMTELTKEIITDASRDAYLKIINRMEKEEGIDGVILGCTEIPLLLKSDDSQLPLFDTTEIHTDYIVTRAFSS